MSDLLLLASEGAGAALSQSISRIFHSGLLLVGLTIMITGFVIIAKRSQVGGIAVCLLGAVLAAYAGFTLAS